MPPAAGPPGSSAPSPPADIPAGTPRARAGYGPRARGCPASRCPLRGSARAGQEPTGRTRSAAGAGLNLYAGPGTAGATTPRDIPTRDVFALLAEKSASTVPPSCRYRMRTRVRICGRGIHTPAMSVGCTPPCPAPWWGRWRPQGNLPGDPAGRVVPTLHCDAGGWDTTEVAGDPCSPPRDGSGGERMQPDRGPFILAGLKPTSPKLKLCRSISAGCESPAATL